MIQTVIIVNLLLANLFSSEYINFGKFENDKTIFVQKNINKLSEKFLGVKYLSRTLTNIDTRYIQRIN
jgi:hypothetical protein